jgi:hypothetical protein
LLVAGVSHSGRARWLQLPHHRRCIGSIKTIESHNTKAPVLQLSLPLVSQPFNSCTSPTPPASPRASTHLSSGAFNRRATMFFLKELEKTIQLHPSYFGPLIRSHIHRELLQKEEGSSTGKYTIVCILDAFDISDGKVLPGSGHAEYIVHYKAIVWRPYKGEVVRVNS